MGSSAAGATGCEFRFGSRVFPAWPVCPRALLVAPFLLSPGTGALAAEQALPGLARHPEGCARLDSGFPPGAAPRDLGVLQGIQDGMSLWPRQAEQHPQDTKELQWLGGLWGHCGRALGAVPARDRWVATGLWHLVCCDALVTYRLHLCVGA